MRLLETEVTSIYEACSSWGDNYHQKVTCVVIQKRHHTCFSSMDTEDGKVQLGSVVESDVCHTRMPDFYLCSAEVNYQKL
nr:argonaute-like protein [Tanacetum cinerariifolium]